MIDYAILFINEISIDRNKRIFSDLNYKLFINEKFALKNKFLV